VRRALADAWPAKEATAPAGTRTRTAILRELQEVVAYNDIPAHPPPSLLARIARIALETGDREFAAASDAE
jgi:hypothetical protein